STIHTNNSIGVVARLVDMGIDPYLIAPTLKLAIAQRLARRIYPDSGREEPVDESFKQMMSREFQSLPDRFRDIIPEMNTIVHPESTPTSTSGMKGRIAIMETLEISQEIQSLILNGAGEAEIYKSARKEGFLSMKEDAIIKALDKEIPLQEVSMFGTKVGEERSISGEYLPIDSEEASQSDENVTSKDEIENSETIPAESNEPISIESMEAEVTEDRNPIENPAAAQGSIVPVDNLKPKR
ncbi:MAG: ATPase, T2SS/T4P/T4SS family, partial [Candidatus Paceibacterota bacterium]